MKCTPVRIGNMTAIVCGRSRAKRCIKCGGAASRLCDWVVGPERTCDAPICDVCTVSPAENKGLCPTHAEAWAVHPKNPNRKGGVMKS